MTSIHYHVSNRYLVRSCCATGSPTWCSVRAEGRGAGGEGGSTGRMADGGGCRQKPT